MKTSKTALALGLVPIMLEGIPAFVAPGDVPTDKWTTHKSEAGDVQCFQSITTGDTITISHTHTGANVVTGSMVSSRI